MDSRTIEAIAEIAGMIRTTYEAFLDKGFDEEDALRLTMWFIELNVANHGESGITPPMFAW